MQILPIYHCKKKKSCSTTSKKTLRGVNLLYKLIDQYGEKKGIAIYAGGYLNPKSLRYTKRALKLAAQIREGHFPGKYSMPLPKEIMWLWRKIK
tara:strand:- start:1734 stop:2015 length:282 start_codon:yes stop_codon:yes gene_type:complete